MNIAFSALTLLCSLTARAQENSVVAALTRGGFTCKSMNGGQLCTGSWSDWSGGKIAIFVGSKTTEPENIG